jgi:hypothetical protein
MISSDNIPQYVDQRFYGPIWRNDVTDYLMSLGFIKTKSGIWYIEQGGTELYAHVIPHAQTQYYAGMIHFSHLPNIYEW